MACHPVRRFGKLGENLETRPDTPGPICCTPTVWRINVSTLQALRPAQVPIGPSLGLLPLSAESSAFDSFGSGSQRGGRVAAPPTSRRMPNRTGCIQVPRQSRWCDDLSIGRGPCQGARREKVPGSVSHGIRPPLESVVGGICQLSSQRATRRKLHVWFGITA